MTMKQLATIVVHQVDNGYVIGVKGSGSKNQTIVVTDAKEIGDRVVAALTAFALEPEPRRASKGRARAQMDKDGELFIVDLEDDNDPF